MPDQTVPAIGRFAYAYEVEIANEGNDEAVQVVSREWRVRDESGFEETISGNGVVGEQPTLAKGETFRYASACVLKRERGSMSGKYTCVFQESRRIVDVVVAPFALTPRERDDVERRRRRDSKRFFRRRGDRLIRARARCVHIHSSLYRRRLVASRRTVATRSSRDFATRATRRHARDRDPRARARAPVDVARAASLERAARERTRVSSDG